MLGDICHRDGAHGFSRHLSERYHEITGESLKQSADKNGGTEIGDCVVQLRKNYRFGPHSGIGKVSRGVNRGDGERALDLLKSGKYHDITWHALPAPRGLHRALRERILEGYKPYLKAHDPIEAFRLLEEFRLICALRKGPYGVSALNLLAEKILREEGLIDPHERWYHGRPLLIRKNDYNLGLFNGDTGMILPDPRAGHDLRAFFPSQDGTLRRFIPPRLPEHETLFAMTVHKGQGSEFNEICMILPDTYSPLLTRELIYTGITRAKERVAVWAKEGVFLEGVSRRIQRSSGLRDALWGT
ncbi:MAG: ATP-binding domain-containing protein [Deltaproteobacteria bacterium]|nr:ATP-binding domain-containing protein [Deltaproteobacteria bacterium]